VKIESEDEVLARQREYEQRIEEQQARMRMTSSEGISDSDDQGGADRPMRRAMGTIRRERPKIGRNDPCWCGSGKKYKKCHMAADQRGESSGAASDAGPDGPTGPEMPTSAEPSNEQ